MKLFYHTYGEGSPLIILHGLFGISDNWVSVGRKLGRFYKVYIPDLRNHGQSPHSPVFDFPALEDDLLEFIESHDLEKVILMGHSLGGKIAMMFALHQPRRVEKLIVVDISMRRYRHNREHQSLIDAMLSVDLLNVKTRSEVDDHLKQFLPSERLRQFALKNLYWRDKEHLAWRLNLNTINQNLHAVFEGVDTPGLYPGPALFIRGGNSSYVSDEDVIGIKKKVPRCICENHHHGDPLGPRGCARGILRNGRAVPVCPLIACDRDTRHGRLEANVYFILASVEIIGPVKTVAFLRKAREIAAYEE